MPRSLKVVIALLIFSGLMALADVLTALGSGAIKVTSGLLFLAAAWGLARSSEFWRVATRLLLGIATLMGIVLLVFGLAMILKPLAPASGTAALPWVMTLLAAVSIVINLWMIRVLGSVAVRRWFEAADSQASATVA
ncbi:MAG: hypothetical protein SF172_13405 [Burkholderiales bacterium]|nr:hypothetical protein [Burkholderiales bacterium]